MDNSALVTKPRLVQIDGLRALAALWVMIGHYAMWDYAGTALPWLHSFTHFNHAAVTFFIVISGFCLALPVLRSSAESKVDARRFYAGRARRILPTYYAALILAIGLDYVMGALGPKTAFEHNVLTHIFLIHDVVGYEYGISAPFWSIALEWHIYFLFPLLIFAWRKWGAVRTCLVTIIGSYCIVPAWAVMIQTIYFYGFDHAILVSPNDCSYYLGLFTLGVLAADIHAGQSDWAKRAREWNHWGVVAAAFAFPLLAVVALYGVKVDAGAWQWVDLLSAFCAASLLLYTSLKPSSRPARFLSVRPLAWLGKISYSLYATHYLLGLFGLDFLRHHVAPALRLPVSVTVLPLLAIAFAAVFAALFEKPFERKSPQLKYGQGNSVPAASRRDHANLV